MEEVMLKNIWEIENNPIFSSGGSVGDEMASPGDAYNRIYQGTT